MIKKNRIKIIAASVVNFLPTLLGLIFWSKISVPTYWGIEGEGDNFGTKLFFVLCIPLILYALFWLCILMTSKDSGNKNQNNKVFGLIIWIMPFMSLFVSAITYFGSTGRSFELIMFLPIVLGLLFAVMGNYMPKCRPNRTIGVRIKWTLENEENWNATHRFSGKVMVAGGLLMILCCFLPEFWGAGIAVAIVLACVLATTVYSYAYYRKQKKLGTYTVNSPVKPLNKPAKIVSAVLAAVILAGVAVLMFTGEVEVVITEQDLTVDSVYCSETVCALDDIQTIQYVQDFEGGVRDYGFSSAKLALGDYTNDKYSYLSYRYVGTDACVVLYTDHGIIAINQSTEEATKALYDELMEKTSK
ncbi:MAG: SdpI family protein [Clostridia bacterium]|nr:SdpI family protein [Clostridia bacterium]